jgi:thiol-disulfide isomerase/thioredoxin
MAALVILGSVGCAPRAQETGERTPAAAAASDASLTATAPTKVESQVNVSLRQTDAIGLEKTLANHRGKVVLVDFWATWCGPCVEQFPHTVALARKYRDGGLAVISLSMDNPSAAPQVLAFLERQAADFDNLLSNYSSPVEATKAFGLPGPVPCYRVYDREGKLHREFAVDPRATQQFTTADVEAAIQKIL